MAKNVKIESVETNELKTQIKDKKNTYEKFIEIQKNNPDFNRSKVAEILGVSRKTIYQFIKQIENEAK
jgi:DNA-binding NtrC family response regulator